MKHLKMELNIDWKRKAGAYQISDEDLTLWTLISLSSWMKKDYWDVEIKSITIK